MHMRRRYQLRRTRRIPIHHGEHISVVGPSDAIAELNQLTRRDPNLLRQAGIERLGSERAGAAPPIRAYADGRWQPQALPRQIDTELSIQVYDCKLQPNVTLPDAIDKLKSILADREEESLKKITVCVDPTVDAPYESSDSPYESSDSPYESSDSPYESSDSPYESSDSPYESSDSPYESSDSPYESSDSPIAVDPVIASNTLAGQPALERIGFNWLRQMRPDLTGADVTVLILDALPVQGGVDVAHEYVDFWMDWVGDQSPAAELPDNPPSPPIIPAAEIHRYHGILVASMVRHLSPSSTIIAARVLDDQGKGWSTTLIQAILWALSHRKNKTMINGRRLIHDKLILNMSMGLPRTQAEDAEAVCLLHTLDAAARAAALAVSASGNDSQRRPENPVEPAAFGFFADTQATGEQVIAVAGTNGLSEYAFFSNEGHIAAPCRHIIGDTGPDSQIKQKYGFSTVCWSGTSFATPQICGLAALLWSTGRVPFYQIKQHIWRTAHLPRRWNGVREIDFVRAFRAI
jgi:subtilisin family serine protease